MQFLCTYWSTTLIITTSSKDFAKIKDEFCILELGLTLKMHTVFGIGKYHFQILDALKEGTCISLI